MLFFSFRQGHSSALKLYDRPAAEPQSVQRKESLSATALKLVIMNDNLPKTIRLHITQKRINTMNERCFHLFD